MKILLFGASGTAGGGVLRACLASPRVESIRAVTRRPLPAAGARLESVAHQDFPDFTAIAPAFASVDACLFCLGKSVTQVADEAEYRRITRDFAMAAARALRTASPAALFHYDSGHGAALDSSQMWARVKAEAESELIDTFGRSAGGPRPSTVSLRPAAPAPIASSDRFIRSCGGSADFTSPRRTSAGRCSRPRRKSSGQSSWKTPPSGTWPTGRWNEWVRRREGAYGRCIRRPYGGVTP